MLRMIEKRKQGPSQWSVPGAEDMVRVSATCCGRRNKTQINIIIGRNVAEKIKIDKGDFVSVGVDSIQKFFELRKVSNNSGFKVTSGGGRGTGTTRQVSFRNELETTPFVTGPHPAAKMRYALTNDGLGLIVWYER